MLKRSTWIWLAIALGLGGGMVAYDQVSQQQEEQQNQENLVLGIEEEDIESFTIKATTKTPDGEAEQQLFFTRPNGEETPTQWQVKINDQDPVQASDGAIAFLTNLIATGQSDGKLIATQKQLAEYGLDSPRAQLSITLKNGEGQELKIGSAGFNDEFVYAQRDPDLRAETENDTSQTEKDAAGEGRGNGANSTENPSAGSASAPEEGKSIYTIPRDFEYALIRELDEWKYVPPSASTPTPDSTPTSDPNESPSPEAPVPGP
ncbi:MAG: DUF4340 domain-containing protein [Cyanophyceae cyanobacterium]